jgi:hypothetical protein
MGLISLVLFDMVTTRRKSNGGGCRFSPDRQQIPRVGHQYGGWNFSALVSRINMTDE